MCSTNRHYYTKRLSRGDEKTLEDNNPPVSSTHTTTDIYLASTSVVVMSYQNHNKI